MIIDTEHKTVFIPGGTTLTLAQLKSLVDLVDTELVFTEIPDPEAGRYNIFVNKIYRVKSHSSTDTYCVVRYDVTSWACSCPDWIHRRKDTGEHCKHINQVYWGR